MMLEGQTLDMKAVEFKSTVSSTGQIAVPLEIARAIPAGEDLQIIVLWEASRLDEAWRTAGIQRFSAAYAPEDSVYEQLMNEPASR